MRFGADPPVVGDERARVGHAVVAHRLAEGDRRVRDLARAVAVGGIAVADGEEVEPAAEVVAPVLPLPEIAVQMVPPHLAAGADRVAALGQRDRVAERVRRLQVVDARAVGGGAEPDAAADVAVAANVELTQVRDLGVERALNPELGVREVGDRVAVVAVAEEPGAKLVQHRRR